MNPATERVVNVAFGLIAASIGAVYWVRRFNRGIVRTMGR